MITDHASAAEYTNLEARKQLSLEALSRLRLSRRRVCYLISVHGDQPALVAYLDGTVSTVPQSTLEPLPDRFAASEITPPRAVKPAVVDAGPDPDLDAFTLSWAASGAVLLGSMLVGGFTLTLGARLCTALLDALGWLPY